MEFDQPEIYLGFLRINEPVTVITDLFVTAVCFYAYFMIRKYPVENRVKTFLLVYFLVMGIATAIGGILGHGFLHYLSFEWKLPGWVASIIAVSFLERASIEQARSRINSSVYAFCSWMNIIKLPLFIVMSITTMQFMYVGIHSALSILGVALGLNIFLYRKDRKAGNLYYIYAVAVLVVSLLIFMGRLGINKWFNHLDVSHLFMALGVWLFYKGSRDVINSEVEEEISVQPIEKVI